jgi:tRNA pseudouridine55 synthase
MPRKKKGRAVNGILVLDKPSGVTSNYALQKVKKLFYAQKAGHTGSLDPLASGVLPICLGEATKVSHFLLDADKRYLTTCQFGEVKTTGDSEGETLGTKPVPEYNEQTLRNLLNHFEGEQEQVPPMYSALKYHGRPLYELARQGKKVERKPRCITIYTIRLIAVRTDSIDIEVHCSKGTYIRTLCEDIGSALGCGAHLTALRRISSGPFLLYQSITMDDLLSLYENRFAAVENDSKAEGFLLTSAEDSSITTAEGSLPFIAEGSLLTPAEGSKWQSIDRLLLPTDMAIKVLPRVEIDEEQYDLIQQGQAINVPLEPPEPKMPGEFYRLYYKNRLTALAVKDKTGSLTPKRLLFL